MQTNSALLKQSAKRNFIYTDNFVGPLELLVELIEKNGLSINRIALSQVADQYLFYISQNKIRLSDLANFLDIAARLVWIKTLSLTDEQEEGLGEEEEAAVNELEERLRIYAKFKKASEKIKARYGSKVLFSRDNFLKGDSGTFLENEDQLVAIDAKALNQVLGDILKRLPDSCMLKREKITRKINLKEVLDKVRTRLFRKRRLSFFQIISKMEKRYVVLAFLAVLELAKKSEATLNQENFNEDIIVLKS